MKEVQLLIMANHWDVALAMKFVNRSVGHQDTVGTLINHCLGTPGLYYTCSVAGYDISIKAGEAVHQNIKKFAANSVG